MRTGPLRLTVVALALSGCPSEPVSPPGPPAPVDIWLGDPVQGTSETLLDGAVQFADLLPGWRTLAQVDGGLLELSPDAPAPIDHGTDMGLVSAVEPLGAGEALVAAEEGLFALQGWGLGPSPLGEVFAPQGDAQLLAAPQGDGLDLWIADGAGLHLWRGGDLFSIGAGDLPTLQARIAWGSPVQGFGALWVAADGLVYALVEQGDSFVTWQEAGALDALALAVDGVDDLWAVLSGDGDAARGTAGDVRRRLPDGTWQWFRLAERPRELVTGASADVWLRSGEDPPRLLHQVLDTWSEVQIDGASPLGPDDTLVGADPAGRVLVRGPTGLRRVSVGRPIVTLGLEDGQALTGLTTVTLVPTLASGVTSVTASLDGVPAPLTGSAEGDPDGWSLLLDPVQLADGAHELALVVEWGDGHPAVEQSLFFSVGAFDPPTWSGDIAQLHAGYCARCHSANGGAHLLDTRARWEDEVEGILSNVISGAMPISGDKLDTDQIRAIELWRAGGFPE